MDNGASSYRRFLDGDESAFDEIMKELFDNLVFFIDRYVHDVHASEDIAIDAFSDLVVNKHRYNFKVTLKTYLFMLGRSRALNYIKHRKVIDFMELTEAEKASSEQETLEEIVLADERKRVVNNALNSLPDDMRVVIHLIYFEDLSYDEAAKVMKKNRKQVDNLLYRATCRESILMLKCRSLAQDSDPLSITTRSIPWMFTKSSFVRYFVLTVFSCLLLVLRYPHVRVLSLETVL